MNRRYADLLTHYCLDIQRGDRVFIRSTYLAEPLLQALVASVSAAGGHPVLDVAVAEQGRLRLENADLDTLHWSNPLKARVMETFEAYLFVRAPFNLSEDADLDPAKRRAVQEAGAASKKVYMERTATRALKRSLCQFPTDASAQAAGLPLSAYRDFVHSACKLDQDDPIAAWEALGREQQVIVDHLNECRDIHYRGRDIDIRFSTEGRTWINSDGRTNMPSGEVYTAPVEDSVQGEIRFSHPSIFMGQEVEDIRLVVRDGEVCEWTAGRGQDVLDQVFAIPGARRFGEAAVGTNFGIDRFTRNILFDEKIGGTIHMAIGQAYGQCGGTNSSTIHWDMIADMTDGGEITADGEVIYRDGRFIIG